MIYFDNSATSFPKPESVYRRLDEFYRKFGANPGRSSHKIGLVASEMMENTRSFLSGFINAGKPQNIVFTYNATDALNMAINGLLDEGDEVITTVLEHNSVSRPLNRLAKEKGIKIVRVGIENGRVSLKEIKKNLTRRTKLVAVNHASNVTGWIQPVSEIGDLIKQNSGAFFLVDAAQSAGILPIDVQSMNVDLLAVTGHKALYGPTGTGGLYVSDRVNLRSFRVGGSSSESESELHPSDMPERLEAGTSNVLGLAGLFEGLKFVMGQGLPEIAGKENRLKSILLEGLNKIDKIKLYTVEGIESLGIISFIIQGLSPQETAVILDTEFDIAVRAGLHCAPYLHKVLGSFPEGTVRISLGYFNSEEDCEKLLEAVRFISAHI